MKTSIAIFLMICLQVAMSPLCLCYGAEVTEEVAPQTCCHAPEGTEPAPCPHCDQELPILATAPVKGDFEAEAPEWNGLSLFSSARPAELVSPAVFDTRLFHRDWDAGPPPLDTQRYFGVFLI